MSIKQFILAEKTRNPEMSDRDISDAINAHPRLVSESFGNVYGPIDRTPYIRVVLRLAGMRVSQIATPETRQALDARNWRMYWSHAAGRTFRSIAKENGLTSARVGQICHRLKRERKEMSEKRDVAFLLGNYPREVCRTITGLDFDEVRVIHTDSDLDAFGIPLAPVRQFYASTLHDTGRNSLRYWYD